MDHRCTSLPIRVVPIATIRVSITVEDTSKARNCAVARLSSWGSLSEGIEITKNHEMHCVRSSLQGGSDEVCSSTMVSGGDNPRDEMQLSNDTGSFFAPTGEYFNTST